jgi:hypothetical protein
VAYVAQYTSKSIEIKKYAQANAALLPEMAPNYLPEQMLID